METTILGRNYKFDSQSRCVPWFPLPSGINGEFMLNTGKSFWKVGRQSSELSILMSGSFRRGGETYDRHAPLLLTRFGPWLPPVSYLAGGVLIVSDNCRKSLLSEMPKLKFQLVQKAKIVEIPYEYWSPGFELANGIQGIDPSEYLHNIGRHSSAAADAMGDVWEMFLPCGANHEYNSEEPIGSRRIQLLRRTWTGWDVFFGYCKSTKSREILVTDQGRVTLEAVDELRLLKFEAVLII